MRLLPRLLLAVFVIVVLGAAVWVGLDSWRRGRAEAYTVAGVGSISQVVVATGRVAPVTEITLANKIPGRIKRVLVKEGDPVKVDQPLVVFDDAELAADLRTTEARVAAARADVRKAHLAVAAARARWAEVKSGPRSQEVERAKAEVDEARQKWENAEIERSRLGRLLAGGFIARSQYDAAAMETDVAKARLRSATERLSLVEAGAKPETIHSAWTQVEEAEGDQRRAETHVRQALAERDRARATLKTATIESPVDGKVTRKLVEPGEAVDVGVPLMVLADTRKTIVKAEVDETDLGKLRVGQQADVTADAFPGRTFPATIYEIGQAVGKRKIRPDDPVKIQDMKVLETKLEILQGADELKLGMTVDVRINVATRTNVLVVPRSAVQLGRGEALVSVLGPNGPERRRIRVGLWDDARVEVTAGLTSGERVLLRPAP